MPRPRRDRAAGPDHHLRLRLGSHGAVADRVQRACEAVAIPKVERERACLAALVQTHIARRYRVPGEGKTSRASLDRAAQQAHWDWFQRGRSGSGRPDVAYGSFAGSRLDGFPRRWGSLRVGRSHAVEPQPRRLERGRACALQPQLGIASIDDAARIRDTMLQGLMAAPAGARPERASTDLVCALSAARWR